MTTYEKPQLDTADVTKLLAQHYGHPVQNVRVLTGGNLSAVFAFDTGGKGFVIRFSDLAGAFDRESYVSHLLSSQNVPYPRIVSRGQAGRLSFVISERVEGKMLADLPAEERTAVLPDLVDVISRMNHVTLDDTSGYGWIGPDGNGLYADWKEYLTSFYDEHQPGSFWENWTELFDTTCLEKDVFDECYARLIDFAGYNAPHRHFVHNDCHAWNMLTDGLTITGIIDGNCIYGDFLIDLSIVENSVPGVDLIGRIREHQERLGLELPHFEQRLIGARYYKGLDGLRFYAKMGREKDYDYLRNWLLNLTS